MKGFVYFIVAMFVLSIIVRIWLFLVVAAGVIFAGFLIWAIADTICEAYEKRETARREARAAVAARADAQHQQYLTGKSSGIYGEFPPVNLDF